MTVYDDELDKIFETGDSGSEMREVEQEGNVHVVTREAALIDLKRSAEAIMSGSLVQISTLHYSLGPDHGYFYDIVLPIAHELAGGRSIVVVDPARETSIPDDCFPVLILQGDQLSKAWMKAFMRLEVSDALAKVLSDRDRHILIFLTLLERTPEPIQPHIRSLLDRHFSPNGDPFGREGKTSILIQIDWQRRRDPGIFNVLDPGNSLDLGICALISNASSQCRATLNIS